MVIRDHLDNPSELTKRRFFSEKVISVKWVMGLRDHVGARKYNQNIVRYNLLRRTKIPDVAVKHIASYVGFEETPNSQRHTGPFSIDKTASLWHKEGGIRRQYTEYDSG